MACPHSTTARACTKCGIVKPLDEFYRSTKRLDGRASACKACETAAKRRQYEAKPELYQARQDRYREKNRQQVKASARKHALKKKYGLTEEALLEKMARQGGRCPICGVELAGGTHKPNSPHIDHNHATGRVRDVLCHRCNIGLGSFGEQPAALRRAAEYLERHNAFESLAVHPDEYDAAASGHT